MPDSKDFKTNGTADEGGVLELKISSNVEHKIGGNNHKIWWLSFHVILVSAILHGANIGICEGKSHIFRIPLQ